VPSINADVDGLRALSAVRPSMLGTWTGLMSFELREQMLRLYPETLTVPPRYARHIMVVADLGGDKGAIEDVVVAARKL
jgi:hypothetical protein